jgi:hypothetical protein
MTLPAAPLLPNLEKIAAWVSFSALTLTLQVGIFALVLPRMSPVPVPLPGLPRAHQGNNSKKC